MTKRRQVLPKLVLDTGALGAQPPKISELLNDGTAAEVREGLGAVATLLRAMAQQQVETDVDRLLVALRESKRPEAANAKELESLVRRLLPGRVCLWLADAFDAIERGCDASYALGLKRGKRIGIRYAGLMGYLIADAVRQGIAREDARDLVSRLNLRELVSDQPDEKPDETKKRLKRATSGPSQPEALKKRLQRASLTQGGRRKLVPCETEDSRCAGLWLRELPSGEAFWLFRFDWRGRSAIMLLGSAPAITRERARVLAAVSGRMLAAGSDPRRQRADIRANA
jgi:hypothetical protein